MAARFRRAHRNAARRSVARPTIERKVRMRANLLALYRAATSTTPPRAESQARDGHGLCGRARPGANTLCELRFSFSLSIEVAAPFPDRPRRNKPGLQGVLL